MEFRISKVVLAVLKINRKTFLNETEIIWKTICFKVHLLYCQLECVHIFITYHFQSVFLFLFLGERCGKMEI